VIEEEGVLSDVHVVGPKRLRSIDEKKFITRFPIHVSLDFIENNHQENTIQVDTEGDFIIRRRPNITLDVINIVHTLDTSMELVGLQVWRGALLLADFIINHEQLFKESVVLELGSGCGIVGIVAGRISKLCFLTDYNLDVLSNCQRNVDLNQHLYGSLIQDPVRVRLLNLLSPLGSFPACLLGASSFHWTETDLSYLKNLDIIIASDIIYQDPLTEALFMFLEKIWTINPHMIFYLSLEKRIQFSVDFLEDISPAYDYFIEQLKKSRRIYRKLEINFPQCLEYERLLELELWEIKAFG